MSEKITWLASYPKSGNTWVRFFFTAYRNGGLLDINNATGTTGDNFEYYTRVVSPLPLSSLGVRGKQLLRPAALLHQLASSSERPLVMKTHNANIVPERLPPLIPPDLTERAIYVVRDPRDVLISNADYFSKSLDDMATAMSNPLHAIGTDNTIPHQTADWSSHVKSWIEEKAFPIHVVRYEDLLENPEEEFTKILKFCGIKPITVRVGMAIKACELARLQKQEKEKGFKENHSEATRGFFGSGGTRWRDELPNHLLVKIEQDHDEMMVRMGYEVTETIGLKAM